MKKKKIPGSRCLQNLVKALSLLGARSWNAGALTVLYPLGSVILKPQWAAEQPSKLVKK